MNQNPVPGWPPGEDGNGNNPALIWNCVDAELNRVALVRQLRIKPGSPMLNDLDDMAASARLLAAPKTIIKPVYITRKNNDSVELDGVRFTSRVLSMNLSGVQRAFVYVVTAGLELDQWAKGFSDILLQYWADRIQQLLLSSALKKMMQHLQDRFALSNLSSMSPGRLENWPIEEQKPLFSLLGGKEREIGVQLTESCLMLPAKTVSGLVYASEVRFESCQLCPRPACEGRKTAYDPELAEKNYQFTGKNQRM
jgi:hypothetical protein